MNTRELLRSAGLRNTRARQSVLTLLHAAERPLSHQEIATRLEKERFDRVTLYRTLATLQEADLVHQIKGVDGIWRFSSHVIDTLGCPGDHPHFLCLKCTTMICLTHQRLPWVEVPEGVCVKGKQLVVYGWCSTCAPSE